MSICTLSLSEKLSNRHNKIWCSIEATLQLKLTKTYDTKTTIAEKDYIHGVSTVRIKTTHTLST